MQKEVSLQSLYVKERENLETYEDECGFVTYRMLNDEVVYGPDVFLLPDVRKTPLAKAKLIEMENVVIDYGKKNGAKFLYGSVVPTLKGADKSRETMKKNGYQYIGREPVFVEFYAKRIK